MFSRFKNMRDHRSEHLRTPSPAMIVALIALFVALGGTTYAAFSLPGNSVGTTQLKNGAVTEAKIKNGAVSEAKIKNGAVTEAKLKNNAVTSGKIKDGSLLARDFSPHSVGAREIATLPGASIVGTSSQPIAPSHSQRITLSTADYDTNAMADTTNRQLVIHTPGKYLVLGTVEWGYTPAPGAFHEIMIVRNGNSVALNRQSAGSGGIDVTDTVSAILQLNVNDTISLEAFQNTGANATSFHFTGSGGDTELPRLQAQWLGP